MNCRKGFTLIELLIVVIIVGVLASIAIPNYIKATNASRVSAAVSVLQSLRQGIISHIHETGAVPNLTDVETDIGATFDTRYWNFAVNGTAGGCDASYQLGGDLGGSQISINDAGVWSSTAPADYDYLIP